MPPLETLTGALSEADQARLSSRPPVPQLLPAYLPPSSITHLSPSHALYNTIAHSARSHLSTSTCPSRSGLALCVPVRHIFRISTPAGPQVCDLNVFNAHNPRERFWAARTRQLHASHLSTGDRLWSCLPYMRPMLTIIADTLAWYGRDENGGRVHDLLGTRCDPYINALLSSADSDTDAAQYDFHCHSNLTRAILPFGLHECDVHDVINLFQVTSLDAQGRYCMSACPAKGAGQQEHGVPEGGDYIEFFTEQPVLIAISACPGGDLSQWGFEPSTKEEMRRRCRELRVDVWKLEDEKNVLGFERWKEPQPPRYRGMHGMKIPVGEGLDTRGNR